MRRHFAVLASLSMIAAAITGVALIAKLPAADPHEYTLAKHDILDATGIPLDYAAIVQACAYPFPDSAADVACIQAEIAKSLGITRPLARDRESRSPSKPAGSIGDRYMAASSLPGAPPLLEYRQPRALAPYLSVG